jgi:hypothetical protein
MPDTDRRIRTISLRLSEVEYEGIKKQYQIHGARNVSDLTRLALQRMMAGSFQGTFAEKLAELDQRVHTLESRISHVPERERDTS